MMGYFEIIINMTVVQDVQWKSWLGLLGGPDIGLIVRNHVYRGLRREKEDTIFYVQVNLIITLSLGSMKTDPVINEPCYNEVIYNRYIAK